MTDGRPKRIDLSDTTKEHGRTLVHLLGYHGDGGENESVLALIVDLTPGENFPESGRIFVGTPQKSPLLEGYFPDLGGYSCSPDAADRLADELKAGAAAARSAMATRSADITATDVDQVIRHVDAAADALKAALDEMTHVWNRPGITVADRRRMRAAGKRARSAAE